MKLSAKYIDNDKFTVDNDHSTTFNSGRPIKADCGDDGIRIAMASRVYKLDTMTVVVLSSKADLLTKNLVTVDVGITAVFKHILQYGIDGISDTIKDSIAALIESRPIYKTIITTDIEYVKPPINIPYIKTETLTTDRNNIIEKEVYKTGLRKVDWGATAGGWKLYSLPTNNIYTRSPKQY